MYRDQITNSVIFQNLLVSKSDKAPKQDNLCKTKVGEKVGITEWEDHGSQKKCREKAKTESKTTKGVGRSVPATIPKARPNSQYTVKSANNTKNESINSRVNKQL